MKEKFTPGPWVTESTHQTPNGLGELIRSANNTHIGWVYSPENARLIACAPGLYSVLQEIVDITDRKHDVWDKAKSVLEKARGES